jgi:hypothetical protein
MDAGIKNAPKFGTDVDRRRLWSFGVGLFLMLGVLSGGFTPADVHGFPLQGPHLLELMSATLSGAKSLRVQQVVQVVESGASGRWLEYQETLSFMFPGRFRSDARYEKTYRVFIADYERTVTVVDGTNVSDRVGRFDGYFELLLHYPRPMLAQALLAKGFDLGLTSLGRFEDEVCYIIGAEYPDEYRSQLWVDKERFLPLRWVGIQRHASQPDRIQRIEFIYRQWQRHGNTWYPMQIDFLLDGRLIRKSLAQKVEVDVPLGADLFDVGRMIATSKPADPPNTGSQERPDELTQTIDDFRKKFQP